MKIKNLFFLALLIIILILFGFMYFLGILNLFMKESTFFEKFKWLDFGQPIIAIFYLIVLSIFFIVVIAIMARIIISLKQDNIKLTSANIDDFSINAPDTSTIHKEINEEEQNYDKIEENINNEMKIQTNIDVDEKIDDIYQSFSQMTNDIIQSLNVAELFEKILFWGATLSNSKRGSLMVIDKNKELYIYKTFGWTIEDKLKIKDIRIPIGEGIAGKVAAENKRIFVTNIEDYEGYNFKYKDKYESKSFISLPIYGLHKVVAVLNLTDNKKNYYSISELEALNIITKLSSKIFELIQIKKKEKSSAEKF
ncbi:MAG: hypothetical protein A2086_00205 [Spirochaetes bacterium GWD1_27_9]|nr:MAG: hypothetical protein A2Z98_04150 [Spirochaetes bacterium GWB1_27_13]OHD20015.1 MAG: hypothetical protein A2Y34_08165 [Spirochaetes bacterium GWC1_27_15]OHD30494.1 MAG: hypothetical protein A2086_00205 [Spirochaetes bacterium GWD1_27_9]